MKILAINSSPRVGGQSKTELLLNHLLNGMRDAGADLETVNLREKTVKNCIGCFSCWTKTPGRCIQKDDMTRELFKKWFESDMVVYATPIYFHTMNSTMAAFRERTLPAALPFFEKGEDGKTFHPLRNRLPVAVWLSVCGLPDESEFEPLSYYLNRTLHKDETLAAEIYRSGAETMAHPFFKKETADIFDAAREAGGELVKSMKIMPETMARIMQPLAGFEFYSKLGNAFWKTCIEEKVTPKEFEKRHMIPRPDSIESFMALFPVGINSGAAGNRRVVMQFDFSGEIEGSCSFIIEKDSVTAKKEAEKHPDITIKTPFALWMDIMTRKADGQQMFMEQKYTVVGDLGLMIELFRKKGERS